MSNNQEKDNKLSNNINDVVDEILGIKSDSPEAKSEFISISESKTSTPPPIPGVETTSTPPPIPNAQEKSTPPPIPTVKRNESNTKSDDDFLKQVLDVVDKDIDANPVDLSALDDMIQKERNASDSINEPKKDVLTKPEPVKYEKPTDGRYERDDEIKLENYHHNLRIEKDNPFKFEKIQEDLNRKNIELIEKKFESIIDAKDHNINELVNKNRQLEEKNENNKLDYAKQIEDFYKRENEQLVQIKSKYEGLLEEKQKLEKDLYNFQLKELQAEQDKLLAEKDALIQERRKLEEEREKREQERKLELEKQEREKQEQLHLERMKQEQEALERQKAVIENLIAEQKKQHEENMRQQEEALKKQMASLSAANRVNTSNNTINKNQITSLANAKNLANKNKIPNRFSR